MSVGECASLGLLCPVGRKEMKWGHKMGGSEKEMGASGQKSQRSLCGVETKNERSARASHRHT